MGHRPKDINMTPEEENIFREFTEYPLAPLEGVPTYEYMTNLNFYLNLCSSAVDFMLICGTLGYLVLMAQPAVFNTHCGNYFCAPKNTAFNRSCPTQFQWLQFCPNSSKPTSTKFVYLTNITWLIVRARRS